MLMLPAILYSLADDLLSGGLAVPLNYRVSIPLSMDAGMPIWTAA